METKKRRYVRRTPESYRKEVRDITDGEYSVLGEFSNLITKIPHVHNDCGTIWEPQPSNFLHLNYRCPVCRDSLARRTPEGYNREVSEITNGEYSVLGEFKNIKTHLLHKHNVCGYEWELTPSHFIHSGSRCPKCAGVSRISDEEFRELVYDLVGEEYVFLDPYVDTKTPLGVKHVVCGHSYKVRPSSFTSRGSRCPNCRYSRGEKAVADVLDSLSIEYSREHTFKYFGLKRYDFFIPSLNIAIEYDGEQHFESIDYWGGDERLRETQESDALKNDFCEYMGIDLLRIPYWEFDNIDEIVTNFIDTVKLMRSISDRKEA